MFFWNNKSFINGIKSIEKVVTLIIFPLIIVGNFKRVKFYKLLRSYTIISIIITFLLFIRFAIISPKFFDVYLKGKELWESGYEFAKSFGMHAPALNMHLSFISICCFWFLIEELAERKIIKTSLNLLLFGLSFFLILIVNTRLALMEVFVGVLVVILLEAKKRANFKKIFIVTFSTFILIGVIFSFYLKNNPYMKEKYSKVTFAHMDKIGNLDSIENPESTIYNSLVTRLSIWKASYEVASENLLYGVGASDSNNELFNYYKRTNQKFLERNQFPPHNQFLNSTIKFGFLGFIVVFIYIFFIAYLGYKTTNPVLLSFFIIFLLSNLVDDFLIRFDGIVFSGFWISIFTAYFLKNFLDKERPIV
ncbi:O-antigen ligase family protein [Polaribacter cellanae]|uniref:O-antigen ligase family protein n=1 Tax=Polaribacter cellanae TaxID=2818493 RepID=A0A975CLH9_9FLAO|nr:O-antigen ligase family protein [Polaribacter cellanae]QTE21499.1 O-antigen ligase family protein [Polaribacter cellanae]